MRKMHEDMSSCLKLPLHMKALSLFVFFCRIIVHYTMIFMTQVFDRTFVHSFLRGLTSRKLILRSEEGSEVRIAYQGVMTEGKGREG